MWLEQFDEAHNRAASLVRIRYLLATTPRSGSHFVGQLFGATGQMGFPLEYFHPGNLAIWRRRARTAGMDDVLRFLESIRTTPNGCFGVKAHYPQLPSVLEVVPLGRLASEWKILHLRRADVLAQAVSLSIAGHTGNWISGTRGRGRPEYRFDDIDRSLRRLVAQESGWQHFFTRHNLNPQELVFEDVLTDRDGTLKEVAGWLGIDPPVEAPIPATERQGEDLNRRWHQQFLEDAQRRSSNLRYDLVAGVRPAGAGLRPRLRRWLRVRRPSK